MSVKRPCKDCMTAGACLAHGCLFKPPGSRAEYEALAAERDAALAQAERLAGALERIRAYDPGTFRPLADEIAIDKIAVESLAAYRQWKEQAR